MKSLKGVFCILLSSILLPLSLPNEIFVYGNPYIGIIALIPLYIGLILIENHGFAALIFGFYGAITHCLSSYWLWYFKDFALWTLGSTTLVYFIFYFVVGGWLSWGMKKSGLFRPLVFVLGWTIYEYFKSNGFLGYPWGLLAYAWNTVTAFNQIADIAGIPVITFILALINASIGETLHELTFGKFRFLLKTDLSGFQPARKSLLSKISNCKYYITSIGWRYAVFAMIAVAAGFSYGFIRLSIPVRTEKHFNAVLVQQNSDSWSTSEQFVLRTCIQLSEKAMNSVKKKADIVIWNESNLDFPYSDMRKRYLNIPVEESLITFIKKSNTYFLFGGPVVEDYNPENFKAYNSAIFVAPDSKQIDVYNKMQLVPFAEVIPLMEYDWFRKFMTNVVGLGGGWEMGKEIKVFHLPVSDGSSVKIGVPICFEDAFALVCRKFYGKGADILVNITNDSWSKTVSAEVQHFVAARYRAIEHHKTLVRSTNSGVTTVIDAYGRSIFTLPLFKSESIFFEIPVYKPEKSTIYAWFGDWFAILCIIVSVIIIFFLFLEEISTGIENKRGLK